MKAFPQFVLFVAAFFSVWFLLNRVDLVRAFNVEEFSRDNERKLGDLMFETITAGHLALEGDSVSGLPGEILSRLCRANGIADTSIMLTVIDNSAVNAFALPDRRMIVHSGLIARCRTPEELAGVIGHEMAHIEHRDVMQKLVKEVGLSMLLTIAGGNTGGEILKQTARTLSSTAFDREVESQADTAALRYLVAARMDPEHFANFLYHLSQEKTDVPKSLEWLSTHPNSSDRAAEIIRLRKETPVTPEPVADSLRWADYRRRVRDAASE
jgi:predicted Zn-dependent protease